MALHMQDLKVNKVTINTKNILCITSPFKRAYLLISYIKMVAEI